MHTLSESPLQRLCVGVALVAALVLAAGCNDSRISVEELQQLEAEIAAPATQPAPAEPQLVEYSVRDPKKYRVTRGDVLTITLYGLQDDPYRPTVLDLRVHDDGAIQFPVVGAIDVESADLAAVERAILNAHVPRIVKDSSQLSVYVQVRTPDETTVLVKGAAAAPGLVRLEDNQRTVLHALAQAGGFTAGGSGRVRVTPIDTQRSERVYDMNDVNDVRSALGAIPLDFGDVVTVETAEDSAVYVTGILNRPAVVDLPRDRELSVMRVIAASGGLVDFLEPEEATLWRRLPDGRQVRVKLDIAKIRSGDEADLALRAGDILDVPHTASSRFRQWFAENVRLGPFGATATYDPVADYRARVLSSDNNNNNQQLGGAFLDILGTGVSNVIIPPSR